MVITVLLEVRVASVGLGQLAPRPGRHVGRR
jgi:hypothetical protein